MKREKLIKSKDYIVSQIQLNLLNLIGNYKDKKKLKDYELAQELGVSKGYVSQLLNATFDHKISKVVDLSLACNTMPLLYFVDIDEFVKADREDKIYELYPIARPRNISFIPTFDIPKPIIPVTYETVTVSTEPTKDLIEEKAA